MTHYTAFIDESGNHDLVVDKSGASKYFIVLAIIVRSDEISSLEAAANDIRRRYFGDREIKSSGVSDKRRVLILQDLKPLDYKFYAIAVNKSEVDRDSGLRYKRSFIKFCNGLLYRSLFQNFPEITIFADAHGGSEFIDSFKNYLNEHHRPDLFSNSDICIVDSRDKVLVQLADLMVGSIARVYENRAEKDCREAILKFLKTKRIRIDEWPQRYEPYQGVVRGSDSELDSLIYSASLESASRFLRANDDLGDDDIRKQCAVLRYLLFHGRFSSDREYVSTQEILDHLHGLGFLDVGEHAVRSSIISKLRDGGVIIASSNKGYKIPASEADIVEFTEFVDGFALPLLKRLNKARETLKLASAGDYDLLDHPRFRNLQRVIGALTS